MNTTQWVARPDRLVQSIYPKFLHFAVALMAIVLPAATQAATLDSANGATLAKGDVKQGSLLFKTDKPGQYIPAPTLGTDVHLRVTGLIVRATVQQTFHNPSQQWVEGVYVFPLPENAAVDHMKLRIGERVIEGRIKEREAAKKTYAAAKQEGRKTSLVEQERPNIFTTSVANLGPGEDVTVAIEYQQTLRYDQGSFRLRFPMVVAPRYIPGTEPVTGFAGTGWGLNTSQVPDAARITPPVPKPDGKMLNPLRLSIDLDAGFHLAHIASSHHKVDISEDLEHRYHISLSDRQVPANKDFELVWTPDTGSAPRAALFTEKREGETYALMMVMPPSGADTARTRLPREAVFIIDTSGSMSGASIEQARQALLLAIDRLNPNDRFNVIQFNSVTDLLFPGAVPADAANLARAKDWVNRLRATGGTEMFPALSAALNSPAPEGYVRQVIFLTDGAVGNEDQLFQLIRERLGDSRLFTVGIGAAPNSHFMSKAAEFGHGTFTYIGNVNEVGEKMGQLFTKLESPVLTDIRVKFPDGALGEMWPKQLPDLYLGEPVMFAASLKKLGGSVSVEGRRGGTPWKVSLPLGGGGSASGIHVLWARSKIASLMDGLQSSADGNEVRNQVIDVALDHHLVSKYTSLVAVDVTPTRPRDESLAEDCALPTNLPEGWDHQAVFGQLPQTATPATMQTLVGALFLLLGLVLLWWRRRGLVPGGRHA
jgi:Ca-activated chloride channel family protein